MGVINWARTGTLLLALIPLAARPLQAQASRAGAGVEVGTGHFQGSPLAHPAQTSPPPAGGEGQDGTGGSLANENPPGAEAENRNAASGNEDSRAGSQDPASSSQDPASSSEDSLSGQDQAPSPARGAARSDQTTAPPVQLGPRTGSPSKPSTPLKFSGDFQLELIYDDNVVRYSDAYLDDFRNGRYPYKFTINTYDDFIFSPQIDLNFERRLLTRRETELHLRYTRWQYTSNNIKTNDAYSIRLRQPTWGRDYIEAGFYYAPLAYIRQLPDRAPFTPSSTPSAWVPFKYTYNSFSLEYSHRFSRVFRTNLRLGRVIRYYNRPHMENDNWEWNYEAMLRVGLSRRWTLYLEYRYSDAQARGADTIGERRETSDDSDPSYERDYYRLALYFRPHRDLRIIQWIKFETQYKAYFFTSQKVLYRDPYHVGRKDEIASFELSADTYRFWGPFSTHAGYLFTKRVTHSPWTGDIAEDKDYTSNRIWLGMNYPF